MLKQLADLRPRIPEAPGVSWRGCLAELGGALFTIFTFTYLLVSLQATGMYYHVLILTVRGPEALCGHDAWWFPAEIAQIRPCLMQCLLHRPSHASAHAGPVCSQDTKR